MRISDWSSDVCSSDLLFAAFVGGVVEILKLEDIFRIRQPLVVAEFVAHIGQDQQARRDPQRQPGDVDDRISAVLGKRAQGDREIIAPHRTDRSEEHTSELQSLMRISYAVFCLKKKKTHNKNSIK